MKKWLFLFLFGLSSGFAQEELMTLESAQVTYQDKKILLNGHVTIEHDLGKVQAERMVLSTSEDKKLSPESLEIEEAVSLVFKEGGELNCDSAFLDYKALSGTFRAKDDRFVDYLEKTFDQSGNIIPMRVKSRQMEVLLENQKQASVNKKFIHELKALEDVTIEYNQEFQAKGDLAHYFRFPHPQKHFSGMLVLQSQQEDSLCELSQAEGNTIYSPRIEINTETRNLKFMKPKGVLKLNGKIPLEFSSQSLIWDDQKHLLTFQKNVFINQTGFGNITNDREILIYLHEVEGKQKLRMIDSSGQTKLNYIDSEKQFIHALSCYGKVLVDHEHLQTTLESPRDDKGEVPKDLQIYFSDHYGEIFADQAVLHFEELNGTPELKQILLKGNVKILNRTSLNLSDAGEFLQYILAERVEFFPKSQQITFIGTKKNRVLFMDEVNSVQISAPALKMIRDPKSQKDSIKGSGDVRFSFLEKELELLRKRFELKKEPQEEKNDS